MLIASTFLLWLIVAILVVAVLALARQIAVLHERIAPMGALVTDGGPKAGEPAPFVSAPALDGSVRTVGGSGGGGMPTLLLFVAPDCPICKKIIPIAMVLAKAEGLKLALVGGATEAELEEMAARFRVQRGDFLVSAQLGLAYRIGKLPSAVLIGADGRIVARGLVNSREHLESLIVAGETGFATAQDYLKSLPASDTRIPALPGHAH